MEILANTKPKATTRKLPSNGQITYHINLIIKADHHGAKL